MGERGVGAEYRYRDMGREEQNTGIGMGERGGGGLRVPFREKIPFKYSHCTQVLSVLLVHIVICTLVFSLNLSISLLSNSSILLISVCVQLYVFI